MPAKDKTNRGLTASFILVWHNNDDIMTARLALCLNKGRTACFNGIFSRRILRVL